MMTPIEDIYKLFLNCRHISTDSRNVLQGSIFFALKGDNFNGNHFVKEALKNGAQYAIVDEPYYKTDDYTLLVPDTLKALQELAMIHRSNIKAKIIAITGSNGKTTTKELVSKVLQSGFNIAVTSGNLNNHIGVPITLLSVKKETEIAIIEMGANHIGEIANLCRIAKPDAGLITNIGKAHLEGFGSYDGVIKAKSELYDYIRGNNGLVFLNSDNELLLKLSSDIKTCTYGSGQNDFCKGWIIKRDPYISIGWEARDQNGSIQTKLFGDYNFNNVLAAVCIGLYYGVNPRQVEKAISSYIPENNRSQVIKTRLNHIILDAYNANPSSMKAALENFGHDNSGSKMIVLGDMMELGAYSSDEHRQIVLQTRQMNFDKVVFIGENFTDAANDGTETCFPDVDQATQYFREKSFHEMTILLKGSRKMQLEKLLSFL